MFRSALAVVALVAAVPAFAGSIPVVSAPATVNPPVSPPPPAAGSDVSAPALVQQVINDANARLLGATGAVDLPPGSVLVQIPNLTTAELRNIEQLMADIERYSPGNPALIRFNSIPNSIPNPIPILIRNGN